MKILSKMLEYSFLILLTVFFILSICQYEVIIPYFNFEKIVPFLISNTLFTILYFVLLKSVMKFWQVFTHELTHVFFALITFNRIEGFTVSFSGGVTSYKGRSNWLIRLGPYIFPLFSFLFIILSLLISQSYKLYFYHLISISYIAYLITLFQHFSFKEPDIRDSGCVFSSIVVLIINLIILVFIILFLQDDLDAFQLLIKNIFSLKGLR